MLIQTSLIEPSIPEEGVSSCMFCSHDPSKPPSSEKSKLDKTTINKIIKSSGLTFHSHQECWALNAHQFWAAKLKEWATESQCVICLEKEPPKDIMSVRLVMWHQPKKVGELLHLIHVDCAEECIGNGHDQCPTCKDPWHTRVDDMQNLYNELIVTGRKKATATSIEADAKLAREIDAKLGAQADEPGEADIKHRDDFPAAHEALLPHASGPFAFLDNFLRALGAPNNQYSDPHDMDRVRIESERSAQEDRRRAAQKAEADRLAAQKAEIDLNEALLASEREAKKAREREKEEEDIALALIASSEPASSQATLWHQIEPRRDERDRKHSVATSLGGSGGPPPPHRKDPSRVIASLDRTTPHPHISPVQLLAIQVEENRRREAQEAANLKAAMRASAAERRLLAARTAPTVVPRHLQPELVISLPKPEIASIIAAAIPEDVAEPGAQAVIPDLVVDGPVAPIPDAQPIAAEPGAPAVIPQPAGDVAPIPQPAPVRAAGDVAGILQPAPVRIEPSLWQHRIVKSALLGVLAIVATTIAVISVRGIHGFSHFKGAFYHGTLLGLPIAGSIVLGQSLQYKIENPARNNSQLPWISLQLLLTITAVASSLILGNTFGCLTTKTTHLLFLGHSAAVFCLTAIPLGITLRWKERAH